MISQLISEGDNNDINMALVTFSDTSQMPSGDDATGVLNIVDVELEEGELEDHHDSQMISQLISEGEDDDIDHTRSKFYLL